MLLLPFKPLLNYYDYLPLVLLLLQLPLLQQLLLTFVSWNSDLEILFQQPLLKLIDFVAPNNSIKGIIHKTRGSGEVNKRNCFGG